MKRLIFFAVVLFLNILPSNFSNAQWLLKSNGLPSSTYSYISLALDAVDSLNAIVSVNAGNYLYRTTDGGNNWFGLNWKTYTSDEPEDISMPDNQNIWAATRTGKILNSTDNGSTWNQQFSDPTKTNFMNYVRMFDNKNGIAMGDAPAAPVLNSVFFINTSIGWAVGYDFSNVQGIILKTTDNGITWIKKNSGITEPLHSIFFINENIGWVVGDFNSIIKTTDGGENWAPQQIPNYSAFNSIFFTDENNGYSIGSNVFLKTTNGGANWFKLTGFDRSSLNKIYFVNKDTGWAAGYIFNNSIGSIIIKTTDGGNSWAQQTTQTTSGLTSIYFNDINNGWASGWDGTILKTTDGGNNWQSLSTGTQTYFTSISFSDLQNGYAVGFDGLIFRTTNGGNSWFQENSNTGSNINAIQSISNLTAYCVGENNIILKTTNGGITWNILNESKSKPPIFLRTTDGGTNWISTNDSSLLGKWSGDMWRRLDFINIDTGYFYTSGGTQYLEKTLNGGTNWSQINYTLYAQVIKFYDDKLGLIYNSGTMYRTIDGGDNWDTFSTTATGWGNDIEFVPGEPAKVWMTDWYNLFSSSDTGRTWIKHFISAQKLKGRDIKFTDRNTGWLLCDSGKVFRTTNPLYNVTDVSNDFSNIPTQYKLEQNFPNPFNISTRIDFTVPRDSKVSLKVFDALGREIETIVNGFLTAGKYSVGFNAYKVATGIYYYQLKAGDYTSTKKMIFLK